MDLRLRNVRDLNFRAFTRLRLGYRFQGRDRYKGGKQNASFEVQNLKLFRGVLR